jgi:hypothetical protein
MKTRQTVLYGIFAVVLALAFTTCDDGTGSGGSGNGGGGSGPTFLGSTLVLSGQVYNDKSTYDGSYSPYNSTMNIVDNDGGSGKITSGQLSYTIGTPTNLDTLNNFFEDSGEGHYEYDNSQISPSNVKGFLISYLDVDSNNYAGLYRGNITGTVGSNSLSYTDEQVFYLYVEGNVTVSAKGKTVQHTRLVSGTTYNDTNITGDYNLSLKEGWNVIYQKISMSGVATGSIATSTYTQTLSLSNPNSLKWILGSSSSSSSSVLPPPQGQRSLSDAPPTP